MQSNKVEPKEVFLFLTTSKTSRVKSFFNNDLESEVESLRKPASNFSRTAASTMASDLLLQKKEQKKNVILLCLNCIRVWNLKIKKIKDK